MPLARLELLRTTAHKETATNCPFCPRAFCVVALNSQSNSQGMRHPPCVEQAGFMNCLQPNLSLSTDSFANLDCYWVGFLDFNFWEIKGFAIKSAKAFCRGVKNQPSKSDPKRFTFCVLVLWGNLGYSTQRSRGRLLGILGNLFHLVGSIFYVCLSKTAICLLLLFFHFFSELLIHPITQQRPWLWNNSILGLGAPSF